MRSFWTGCRRKRSRLGWAMPPVQEAGCALVAARRLMSAGMGVALTRIRMAQQLERWGGGVSVLLCRRKTYAPPAASAATAAVTAKTTPLISQLRRSESSYSAGSSTSESAQAVGCASATAVSSRRALPARVGSCPTSSLPSVDTLRLPELCPSSSFTLDLARAPECAISTV